MIREGRWNHHTRERIGEERGELTRKEKNEKERKEGSVLVLPVTRTRSHPRERVETKLRRKLEEREKVITCNLNMIKHDY